MTLRWKISGKTLRKILPHVLVWTALLAYWAALEYYAEDINFLYPQLTIKIDRPPVSDSLQVLIDLGNGFSAENSSFADITPQKQIVHLDLLLPDRDFLALRIDPKLSPGTLSFAGMELRTRAGHFQWTAKDLITRFFPWHDIDRFAVNGERLHMSSSGNDPYFVGPYSVLQTFPVPLTSYNVRHSIDVIRRDHYYIVLQGWAFLEERFPKAGKVFVVLRAGDKTFLFDTFPMIRKDVSRKYGFLKRLDLSGFTALIHPSALSKQTSYQIGLVVRNGPNESFVEAHKILKL